MKSNEIIRVEVISRKGPGWYRDFIGKEYDVIIPIKKNEEPRDRFLLADTAYNRKALIEVGEGRTDQIDDDWFNRMFCCWIERQDLKKVSFNSNKNAKTLLKSRK